MQEAWLNPSPAGRVYTKRDIIFVDSSVAPTASPAPAGNAIVPTGWIRQIAQNGSQDTDLLLNGQYVPSLTQFCVPYNTGGWPTDPLRGQPGHTPDVFTTVPGMTR